MLMDKITRFVFTNKHLSYEAKKCLKFALQNYGVKETGQERTTGQVVRMFHEADCECWQKCWQLKQQ